MHGPLDQPGPGQCLCAEKVESQPGPLSVSIVVFGGVSNAVVEEDRTARGQGNGHGLAFVHLHVDVVVAGQVPLVGEALATTTRKSSFSMVVSICRISLREGMAALVSLPNQGFDAVAERLGIG